MTANAPRRPGRILTFYSYKGGTGRSMAVANLAWILASSGKRVLAIDWDLEAPGLHRYFRPFLVDSELGSSEGLIELVEAYATRAVSPSETAEETRPDWYVGYADYTPYVVSINYDHFPRGGKLDLLPAGRQNDAYGVKISSFNWQNLYDRLGGGALFEAFKARARSEYDFVLIDSRTGVSDTAGICSVQMPDALVVCFTLNNQSIRGAAAVSLSARKQRQKLERDLAAAGREGALADTRPFRIFPVPMRVENGEKDRLALRQAYARQVFAPLLDHLSPTEVGSYWSTVEVPHDLYYSYEEVLATLKDDPEKPTSVLAAYLHLTKHITDDEIREYRLNLPPEERQKYLEAFSRTAESLPAAAAAPSTESPGQALIRRAEAAYASLDEPKRAGAMGVLTRLVRLGESEEGGGISRARIPLTAFSDDQKEILSHFAREQVVTLYGAANLGTNGKFASVPSALLADEQLAVSWPRLVKAVEADREFLLWRQRLRTYLEDWKRSRRDHGALLSGPPMSEAVSWALKRFDDLNEEERAYIDASKAGASVAAGPARRSPRFAAGAAAAVVIVAGVVLWLWRSRPRADAPDPQRKEYSSLVALAMARPDPAERALALDELARRAPAELGDVAIPPPEDKATWLPSAILRSGGTKTQALAVDAASGTFGVVSASGTVSLWELPNRKPTVLQAPSGSPSRALALAGNRIAVGTDDGTVYFWPSRSADPKPRVFATRSKQVRGLWFVTLEKQDWLLVSSEDGTVGLWNLGKGTSRLFYPSRMKSRLPLRPWDDVRLWPSEGALVAVSKEAGMETWDATAPFSYGVPWRLPPTTSPGSSYRQSVPARTTPLGFALGDDGVTAVLLGSQATDAPSEILISNRGAVTTERISAPFKPDLLALGPVSLVGLAADQPAFIYGPTRTPVFGAPPPRRPTRLVLNRDGRTFLAILEDGRAAVWQTEKPQALLLMSAGPSAITAAAFLDAKRIACTHADGSLRVWELQSGPAWPASLQQARDLARNLDDCLSEQLRVDVLGDPVEKARTDYRDCAIRKGRAPAAAAE